MAGPSRSRTGGRALPSASYCPSPINLEITSLTGNCQGNQRVPGKDLRWRNGKPRRPGKALLPPEAARRRRERAQLERRPARSRQDGNPPRGKPRRGRLRHGPRGRLPRGRSPEKPPRGRRPFERPPSRVREPPASRRQHGRHRAPSSRARCRPSDPSYRPGRRRGADAAIIAGPGSIGIGRAHGTA
jgi:hypothetical protein